MAKLYRPVGVKELELILDSDSKEFPPRLSGQPIFYPVLNVEYARKIAAEWNTKDVNSGYAGYVLEFEIADEYVSTFKVHTVGSSINRELWVPAEKLGEFNYNLISKVLILEAFYGEDYIGPMPIPTILKNKGLKEQLLVLNNIFNYNNMDFRCEVAVQWKLILMNFFYWFRLSLTKESIGESEKMKLLRNLYEVLKDNQKDLIVNVDKTLYE